MICSFFCHRFLSTFWLFALHPRKVRRSSSVSEMLIISVMGETAKIRGSEPSEMLIMSVMGETTKIRGSRTQSQGGIEPGPNSQLLRVPPCVWCVGRCCHVCLWLILGSVVWRQWVVSRFVTCHYFSGCIVHKTGELAKPVAQGSSVLNVVGQETCE